MTKHCNKCGQDKFLSEFYKDKKGKFGVHSICKECKRKNGRENYRQNPEKKKIKQRQWELSSKGQEYIACYKKEGKHLFAYRKHVLKKKYGLTLEEYDKLVAKQNGVCAICGKRNGRILVVDHNHQSNKVRGLLCDSCNLWLGRYEAERELFRKFDKYLGQNLQIDKAR